jgi:ESS family glutamate:Na+ symporter
VEVSLPVSATLAIAALVLVVGRHLIGSVNLLRKYSIPDAVAGGLLAAILVAALYTAGVRVTFDTALQPALMLAFFATIGLGADVMMLARGGVALILFTACVVGMLVVQDIVGVGAALAMNIDPVIGLIAGSVTMAGGHGTGAAWGQRFAETYGLTAAPGIALAAATFGLVIGGLIGGPVAERLVRRLEAKGAPLGVVAPAAHASDPADSAEPFTPERLTFTIFLIAAAAWLGVAFAALTENPRLTLPTFVWTLFAGVLLRNVLVTTRLHAIDDEALNFAGSIALSLFLAMALMSLRLWELATLALPMFAILALQAACVVLFTTLITFRVMGADYEAAVLVAGQCGFGLGATPTAIANMQAIARRHGYAPRAFILVPVVGAFLIDLANALVISGFSGVVQMIRG